MRRFLCCCGLLVVGAVAFLAPPGRERAIAARIPHQPKIALDSRAIARAKRITIRFSDLPLISPLTKAWFPNSRWKPGLVNKVGPALACRSHVADLTSVTFKGGWSSQFIRRVGNSGIWILTSSAVVQATPKQARLVFDDTELWTRRYCFPGAKGVTSVSRVRPPSAAADQEAEILIGRVDRSVPDEKVGSVLVLLRCGSVFIGLTLDWRVRPVPDALVKTLAEKIVARANK